MEQIKHIISQYYKILQNAVKYGEFGIKQLPFYDIAAWANVLKD